VSINQSPRQLRLSTYCCSPLLSLSQQFFSSSFASTLPLKATLKQFCFLACVLLHHHTVCFPLTTARTQDSTLITDRSRVIAYQCPQRCWSHQINWITWVLQTETVSNRCYVNRQISVSYYQQISNCCRPVLTYRLTDLCHQWLTDCWSCSAFSLSWQLCTVGHGIFIWPM